MAKPNRQVQSQPAVQVAPAATSVASVVVVTAAEPRETGAELITKYGSKSAAVRALAAPPFSMKVGPISKKLGIIYQFARNVLKRPLKREIKAERDAKNNTGAASTGGNTPTVK